MEQYTSILHNISEEKKLFRKPLQIPNDSNSKPNPNPDGMKNVKMLFEPEEKHWLDLKSNQLGIIWTNLKKNMPGPDEYLKKT